MTHQPLPAITTPELIEEIAKLRKLLEDSKEKRHEGNGALNSAFISFQNSVEEHADRIEVVEKVMLHDIPMLVRDIQIIKTRIVGDDTMKIPGFFQQMSLLDNRVTANSDRLDQCEKTTQIVKEMQPKLEAVSTLATANSWDLKVMKIVGGAVTSALIALGGLITWVKATEIIKFLSPKS